MPSLLDFRIPLYLMTARCCDTLALGTPKISTSSLTVFSPSFNAFRISILFGLARVLQTSDWSSNNVLSFFMLLFYAFMAGRSSTLFLRQARTLHFSAVCCIFL